jgi:hypothetical protein
MQSAIVLQPILGFLLQLAAAAALAFAVPMANKLIDQINAKFNLQANAVAHATIDGVVEDAVHAADAYANTAITRVGPIETNDPKVAAAANFILSHAPEELAQLGFTEQHVVELVRSAQQQRSTSEKA